jgi:hypothetical protein
LTVRPTMELADYIRELTETHSHAEHYQIRRGHTWYGANHVTKVPALLVQLWSGDVPSAATEDGPRPGFGSKPAARLDALDTATRIDIQAHRWITDLGEQARSLDTIAIVRQLHGLTASAATVTKVAITRDVRSWWTQARIVTGWDSPAWSPDNTCPMCGERGTLKVRWVTGSGCARTTPAASRGTPARSGCWPTTSGRSRRPSGSRRRRGPCWCDLPRADVADLAFLCPSCGSAYCRHAVMTRLLAELGVDEDRMRA